MKRFGLVLAAFGWATALLAEEARMIRYTARRVEPGALEAMDFSRAETGRVSAVRLESSEHRPETTFRVLHDGANLYVCFRVRDRYVRSVQTAYQAQVCTDSCVEFFVQPKPGKGYFNFEVNAGGTLLLYYVEDPVRTPHGLAKSTPVSEALGREVEIRSSLPRVVEPEIAEPVDWEVRYQVPLKVFEAYVGSLDMKGAVWRANFYKCGDKTSHPHWLSWSPVTALNFHLPACFGELALE